MSAARLIKTMKQGWEIKKLGEVCSITMGQSPSSDTYNDSEGLPFFQGNADFGKIHPSIRVYCNAPIRIADVDDILISVRAPIGAINIADCKCCIGRGLASIRNNAEVANEYIYHALIANKEKLIAQGTGSTFKSIGKEALKELSIPVPPREEQERIVEELDCLSGVIEKKREQLRELDALAQSIFYTMFGAPITNEKGWEVKKLEELCDIINGFAFPSSDFADCNPIKVIKITNVGVNEFISDDSSLPDDYNNMEGCKVHTGDIVIALTRTIISTGVKLAIVPNEYNESLVNQRVAAILANDRIVSRRFIYSFLGTDFVRQYILQKATALMQPNLSIRDLRDMPTIYPPLALQHEFADKIEAIERQKELIKQSITETEELFNARMDYYFN